MNITRRTVLACLALLPVPFVNVKAKSHKSKSAEFRYFVLTRDLHSWQKGQWVKNLIPRHPELERFIKGEPECFIVHCPCHPFFADKGAHGVARKFPDGKFYITQLQVT